MTAEAQNIRVGLPRLFATAGIIAIGLVFTLWALRGMTFPDSEAYWQAALRLREEQPLYPHFPDPSKAMYYGVAYRYAPWFAFAWLPLTFLPKALAIGLWVAAIGGASAVLCWQLTQRRAWLMLALFGPLLMESVAEGNVQPLMILGLAWGLERRSGPLWVAIAASLKAVPILFVMFYLGRRQWAKAAWTVALTGLLVAPMLLFDLSGYPTDPGSRTLFSGPLYVAVAGVAMVMALLTAASRYGRLSASLAALLALPRFWPYDLTLLLVGLGRIHSEVFDLEARAVSRGIGRTVEHPSPVDNVARCHGQAVVILDAVPVDAIN